ncbi:thioesterase II family protein [Mesorhizobium sp. CO1-1-8]|uniref:thioesterase II family protein n=1 Tax=Mesorhizobium sp. CO1-1-8 TaxID=2876631 RepID=UPI001CD0983F|nr:thioesterase domain-containing protein [Mesorhizobium sp. CO1-1-8]MBZ9771000.1 thioesterase [Mesorhizobium sp. CO1-1-8]
MARSSKEPWLSGYESRPSARLRLFCFPFAGGSASAYRGWSAGLPQDVEVCPVQLPGREARYSEPAFRSIPELVPVLADVLRPMFDLPFAFYGHSLGSLIAFELAHELKSRGEEVPAGIFAAAHQAPKYPHGPAVSRLSEPDLIAHVEEMNPDARFSENPSLWKLILPILRVDLALCDYYVYRRRPKLSCAITAFGGAEDSGIAEAALNAWGEETEGPFSAHVLPGGHFFVAAERERLLALISEDCRRLMT